MAFPKKCLSIDVGNHQIKIAELQRSGNTVKVLNHAMIKTPDEILSDGLILNKDVMTSLVSEAIKSHKMKTKDVIFTIASSKIITREVEFPQTAIKKLKSIIHMNASEYFPVNLEDYVLDHYIIDTVASEGNVTLKVNVIAAFSELVEDYVELAQRCGLKPQGVDYSGISLANFAVKDGLDEGTNIVLDIGSDSTMVSILDNGVMKFNRNLMYGSSLLIDSIKNHFEVEEDEALRISVERSLLNVDSSENPYLSNDMTGAVNQILQGIGRLVDYYTSRNSSSVNRIYIVGGGANIHGLSEYISEYFNIPTVIPRDMTKVIAKTAPGFEDVQLYFINNIGAMFSEISLVPKSMLAKEKQSTKNRTFFLLALLLILPIIALTYFKWTDIQELEDKKQKLTLDIQNAQPIIAIKNEYTSANARLAFRELVLYNSRSTTDVFTQTMLELQTAMPEEVFITRVTNTEEGINMGCIADDKLTVAEFIKVLKDLGYREVLIPGLADSNDVDNDEGVVVFNVSMLYPEVEVMEDDQ